MRHVVRCLAFVPAVLAGTYYPFLPGDFDSLAPAISITAQMFSIAVLLFVPLGVIWLLTLARTRPEGPPSPAPRGVVGTTAVVAIVVVALTALAGWGSGSAAAASLVVAAAVFSSRRFRSWLNRMAANRSLARAWAWQMIGLPLVVLALSVAAAPVARAFSRSQAIDHAAVVIGGLENYRAQRGEYPESFVALSADFGTGVVGIDRFLYARHGAAYTLSFTQPSLAFWRPGTEEVLVYNPRDEHLFPSHAAWFLESPTGVIRMRQGFYEEGEAERPHWRYFWFD